MSNPLIYSRIRNIGVGEKTEKSLPKCEVIRIDEKQEKLMKEILYGKKNEKEARIEEKTHQATEMSNCFESPLQPTYKVNGKTKTIEGKPQRIMTLEELMEAYKK